ncbi:MAG: hypothetical protein ABJQ34_00090 [Paracoccaceae bacterium]
MGLRPIGRLVQADIHGILPRIGRAPHASWHPILKDIADQFKMANANGLFSMAVRGSVARGASVSEAADLDLVLIFDDTALSIKDIGCNAIQGVPVEISFIPCADFHTHEDWAWMRFTLAHSGYTVFGHDYLPELLEPQIGPHCVAHLRDADRWLRQWEIYWEEDKDYHAICEWLMKRIVRSLFESQLKQLNGYTRDIYPCFQVAVEAFPHLRCAMLKAAELAVSPDDNQDDILKIVDQLSPILLSKQTALFNDV